LGGSLRLQCRNVTGGIPPSTSMIRHMLQRASASAKGLAAALRRAVREWQMLSGWVRTGLDEMVRSAMVKRLSSDELAEVHVNAMSTRICHFARVYDGGNRLVSSNVRS
jgi:hypothetical protein